MDVGMGAWQAPAPKAILRHMWIDGELFYELARTRKYRTTWEDALAVYALYPDLVTQYFSRGGVPASASAAEIHSGDSVQQVSDTVTVDVYVIEAMCYIIPKVSPVTWRVQKRSPPLLYCLSGIDR